MCFGYTLMGLNMPPHITTLQIGSYSNGRNLGNSRIYGYEKKEGDCLKDEGLKDETLNQVQGDDKR